MNRIIGPYIFSRRTEYSKLKVYDFYTGKELKQSKIPELNEIMDAYTNQMLNPQDFFVIKDNCIIKTTETAAVSTKYFFIPDGITKIEIEAFDKNKMRFVSLPDSLTTIKQSAFFDCQSLESIYIPDSVEKIENGAFGCCRNLKSVRLPKLETIEEYMFLRCWELEDVIIPDSVTTIDDSAFCGCISLKEIKLPPNLKRISFRAFGECANLEKVNLPNSLTSIDIGAFSDCTILKEITIPDNVNILGPRAFANCVNLKHITLPERLPIIQEGLFSGCKSLKSVHLPDDVNTIEEGVFLKTENLKSVEIPRNLKFFSNLPFATSSIRALIFNHDLEDIECTNTDDEYDLLDWSFIKKIVINNNVTKISEKAFCVNGDQIEEIDYLGTKEQFEEFKRNNSDLFNVLTNIKEVNILGNEIEKEGHIEEQLR